MAYRKDVQMLRGVAVLLVVLFHLGIAGFESGFLGVDVFFVISGYLMAVMYSPEEKGAFFGRRAKRLLPAYLATVVLTLVFALARTTPNDFLQVAEQAIYATFFASNIGFWFQNSYFDKAAFKPLLHLWSLGVEIQFYALVPAFYWLWKKTGWTGLVAVAVVSLAACSLAVTVSPKTSFFWMPLRLWEFLLGFGVAQYLSIHGAPGRLRWLGAACFVLIVLIPTVEIDGTAQSMLSGHPGLAAVVVVAATALVLLTNLPSTFKANAIATGLERLGNYSYSIYLAHFPIIVLFLYQPFAGTLLNPSGTQLLATAALIMLGSAILYTIVEKPLRHSQPRPEYVIGTVATVLLLSTLGVALQNAMIPPAEAAIYGAWTDRAPYRCGKVSRILRPGAITCEVTPPNASPTLKVLLVGNSHADSIKTTFTEAAQARNVTVFFMVENAPLQQGGISPERLMAEALRLKVDAIVLHHAPDSLSRKTIEQVVQLAKADGVQVSFIMPVPVWNRHVPKMLWEARTNGTPVDAQSLQEYVRANSETYAATNLPYLKVYEVASTLCQERCRLLGKDGKPLYFDKHHLTLTGSSLLRPVFDKVLKDLLENRQSGLSRQSHLDMGNEGSVAHRMTGLILTT